MHGRYACFGNRSRRGFGDDAHDRFGVAGAGVDPGVGPVDANAVLDVDLLVGEFFFNGLNGSVGVFATAGELGFYNFIAWQIVDNLLEGLAHAGHQLQDVSDTHKAITAGHDTGIDHATVAKGAT